MDQNPTPVAEASKQGPSLSQQPGSIGRHSVGAAQWGPLEGFARPLPEQAAPDRFVLYGAYQVGLHLLETFADLAIKENPHLIYKLETRISIYAGDTHHPEWRLHPFAPVRDFPPESDGVYVFRKCARAPVPSK